MPLATFLPPVPISIASLFIGTFGGAVFNINQLTLRQSVTPPEMLGRMNATVRFVTWGTLPLGGLAGGVLGTVIGVPATIWVGAIGSALAFVPIIWSPIADLREIPDGPIDRDGRVLPTPGDPSTDPLPSV